MGKGHRRCEVCGIKEAWNTGNKLLFSKFPQDPDRCREWLKAVGNEELVYLPIEKLHEQRNLCAKHFGKRDFNKKGNRLKRHAIPTLNLMALPLSDGQLAEFPQHVYCHSESKESHPTATVQNEDIQEVQSGCHFLDDEHNYCQSREQNDNNSSGEPIIITGDMSQEHVYSLPSTSQSDVFLHLQNEDSLNDEQRRKQLEMREERRPFSLRRTGISAITEVEDIIEMPTCSVADDISCAEEVEVCWVCLAMDVKMYNLRDTELTTMFQNITGITLNESDHAILGSVCWECAARLKAAATFRSKALLSDSLLQDLINTGEQIRKRDITTIKEKESSLTKTLTAIEVFHIVDIEDQNVTQPLQSAEDSNQSLLSENNIIIEIQQENPAMDVEEDEIKVPIKFEIEDYLCFNNGEKNNQDSTFSREDTTNLVYNSSLLDAGVPLLETRIKTKENNPKDQDSSRGEEQINKNVNKINSNSEMNTKILPEQTTEPNKRRKEAMRYGHTYLKAVTKVGSKKKK